MPDIPIVPTKKKNTHHRVTREFSAILFVA